MASPTVVDTRLQDGQQIISNLDANGLSISVAFWAKLEEYADWRLFIASEELDRLSLFEAYSRIADAGFAKSVFDEEIIAVLRTRQELVAGLRRRFHNVDEEHGLRISSVSLGERFIEEGLLLRLR